MERIQTDILVIGAGVIGLSVAAKLSQKAALILVESFPQFGRETSSRNSEVVHSGIYYPVGSLKTQACIEGRRRLYEFCEQFGVPFAKVGKFVVSTQPEEDAYLEKLAKHCQQVDVPVTRELGSVVMQQEPLIQVREAVFLPETGIVNSHALMAVFERQIVEQDGLVAYRHRVRKVHRDGNSWITQIQTPEGELEIQSEWVINAAGLAAAELSNAALQEQKYEHRFCRGRYFSLSQKYQNQFKSLIYPVPPKDGLGIHVTVDLDGFARLGPDVDWCLETKNYAEIETLYDCDWNTLQPVFTQAVRRYCPQVESKDLSPALIGVRPKLFIDGKAQPDFLIENLGGFIHCLGIESPGLTSSLALAEHLSRFLS